MPDFTDEYLLPFPTEEEYGDGSNMLEELARAIDPLIVAQNARVTTLNTRPTVIRNRATDQAVATSFPVVTWDNQSHNNFSAVNFETPAPGAHPVAGIYPALWRFDLWLFFIATAPVLGDTRHCEVNQQQILPGTTGLVQTRSWTNDQIETNTGGEYMSLSGATLLDRPATFTVRMSFAVNGNIKAGTRMGLTRIRSV